MKNFVPHHINASKNDLNGNDGIGRYILLPGSDGRASEISDFFDQLEIKKHPRGHNLYLGTLHNKGRNIDVATISSGMGCPSLEIILHELFHLGGKRFLRVGTAGSLQNRFLKIGDMVNAQASVRDDKTSSDYVPLAVPAIASYEFVEAINQAAKKVLPLKRIATGIVHCKSSFYAREFGLGPNGNANLAYIDLLTNCGVLASEMETAALFIQSQIYNHQLTQEGVGHANKVLAGAVLGILAEPPHKFADQDQAAAVVKTLITLGLETITTLAELEGQLQMQKDSLEVSMA